MSKLVEAEMDGAAAAKQVMALKDTIGKLKTVRGGHSDLALQLGPERGVGSQPARVGARRSHQADFMTSPGGGRAPCAPQLPSPTLRSRAGPSRMTSGGQGL